MPFVHGPKLDSGAAATGLRRVGALVGLFLVCKAVVVGCVRGDDLATDLRWVAVFGIAAVVLLAGLARLANVFLLGRLQPAIEHGNLAAAIAAGAHHVAAGALISHCVYGTDVPTLGFSLVLLAIASLTLLILLTLFRTLTSYDDDQEIAGGNVAAALSYAGVSIAISTLVGHAADRSLIESTVSLRSYLTALAVCVTLYPVRQVLVQRVFLGLAATWKGGGLDALVGRDRNVPVAAIEAAAYVATATLMTGLV